MGVYRYDLLIAAGVATLAVWNSASAEPVSVDFSNALQVDFAYIDSLQSPVASSIGASAFMKPWQQAVSPVPTLGLTRIRSDLAWRVSDQSEFLMTLRPESTLRSSVSEGEFSIADFDSRAGQVGSLGAPYHAAPRIKFVDAYELRYSANHQFYASLGVREALSRRVAGRQGILQFGLDVQLPHHTNFIGVNWQNHSRQLGLQPGVERSNLTFDLAIIQGREDRGDVLDYRGASDDYAPTSRDPYLGLMLGVDWVRASQWNAGLIAGYRGHTHDLGPVTETFAQFYAVRETGWRGFPIAATLDARYTLESWQDSQVPDLAQQSLSLQAATFLDSKRRVGLGVHFGVSDRHDITGATPSDFAINGYQFDLDFEQEIHEGLSWAVKVAHEQRELNQGGNVRGAFLSGEDGSPSQLQRFALELHYQTGSVR